MDREAGELHEEVNWDPNIISYMGTGKVKLVHY